MTENKRFKFDSEVGFIDVKKCRGDTISINEVVELLNKLSEENKKLRQKVSDYADICACSIQIMNEDEKLKEDYSSILCKRMYGIIEENKGLQKENEQLKSENKRLTDKLNKTALELVDECISQGKATEISEMSYREFLDYRAENGKPMKLHL